MLYILSILFCWYSTKKAYEGEMRGCQLDFIDVMLVFIPFFNILTGISMMEEWKQNQGSKERYYKFFKLK